MVDTYNRLCMCPHLSFFHIKSPFSFIFSIFGCWITYVIENNANRVNGFSNEPRSSTGSEYNLCVPCLCFFFISFFFRNQFVRKHDSLANLYIFVVFCSQLCWCSNEAKAKTFSTELGKYNYILATSASV